ncbi:hypothetical protein ACQKP0_02225 [Heyndrickxia sp. NPDC080065]|uniref:hypothetical protein n=1 Tax=Heyndrickxia sp. NPDC080065 TaxID=3390568 RepID=UPI003D02882D
MNIELSLAEKQYLNEVLDELKQYQISSKVRKDIKQQLLEHIQESREHDQNSLDGLGDSTTFVKDFLEINGIDLHSEIKQMRKSKSKKGILLVIGFFTLIVTYLFSQLILSMFLTESINPQNNGSLFDYNIFYQISDNSWWNFLLIIISISTSCLVSVLVVILCVRKLNLRRK